ncbi:MAG: Uma2 family endonuclease, partial [Actinobacteria bacterium]|nr:Uma2 family endonuclease [Actinomycetota bacterium]
LEPDRFVPRRLSGMALRAMDRSAQVFTYPDLEAVPDDENRYELSYGALIVTPAPNTRHQALIVSVAAFLHQRKPASVRVLAEAELLIRPDLVKRPDVQVVDENLVGGQCVVGTPSLVVEIHSPATMALDLTEKRLVYAEAHIPAYWLIDPDAMTLTILELADGQYIERAILDRDAEIAVSRPFSMTVSAVAIFS